MLLKPFHVSASVDNAGCRIRIFLKSFFLRSPGDSNSLRAVHLVCFTLSFSTCTINACFRYCKLKILKNEFYLWKSLQSIAWPKWEANVGSLLTCT